MGRIKALSTKESNVRSSQRKNYDRLYMDRSGNNQGLFIPASLSQGAAVSTCYLAQTKMQRETEETFISKGRDSLVSNMTSWF